MLYYYFISLYIGYIFIYYAYVLKILLNWEYEKEGNTIFVIGVYDIKENRVNKVRKIFDKFLYRVQKSVYEGEIKVSSFEKLKSELKEVVDLEEDSVIFYTVTSKKYIKNEVVGIKKDDNNIL